MLLANVDTQLPIGTITYIMFLDAILGQSTIHIMYIFHQITPYKLFYEQLTQDTNTLFTL